MQSFILFGVHVNINLTGLPEFINSASRARGGSQTSWGRIKDSLIDYFTLITHMCLQIKKDDFKTILSRDKNAWMQTVTRRTMKRS